MSQELRYPPSEIDLAAFISKEAHDLKSPFNRILGFLKIVLDGLDGPISEQAQEDLTIAYQNTQYNLTMMSSLVDIARLGRNELLPTLDLHALDTILEGAIVRWTDKYHRKNQVEVTHSAPNVEITADEIMIQECIRYWISYVNEFTDGMVTIKIQAEAQPEVCLVTICSDGSEQKKPPECDLTLYGISARGLLDLHQGELLRLEAHERGALVQFSLPIAQP